jgi:hypothetical protein
MNCHGSDVMSFNLGVAIELPKETKYEDIETKLSGIGLTELNYSPKDHVVVGRPTPEALKELPGLLARGEIKKYETCWLKA